MVTLPQLRERGRLVFEMIRAQLGAFEVQVTYYPIVLPEVSEFQYHLAVIFMTESDPEGGWWFDSAPDSVPGSEAKPAKAKVSSGRQWPELSSTTGAQDDERAFLELLVGAYAKPSENALSSRIFGICCGLNLLVPGVLDKILKAKLSDHWSSLLLPTTPALVPEEWASMFPMLFTQLYYRSAPFKSAVTSTWARSNRARIHTDLLIIENPGSPSTRTVQKYCYAPAASRPWGVDMPDVRYRCGCPDSEPCKWTRRETSGKPQFQEYFATLVSLCKREVLYVAVFKQGFKLVQIAGTSVVVQPYSEELQGFPLDQRDRVQFRAAKFEPDAAKPSTRLTQGKKGQKNKKEATSKRRRSSSTAIAFPRHVSPWTGAGIRAYEARVAASSQNP
ncbi:hypothetical protein FRC09_008135 [Ceratobasidium sp. 395]|nr:hypothetical protein FRC09_008135 [Ceratobasidium sp. 395]